MLNKKPWYSKTLIANFVVAGLALVGFGDKLSGEQVAIGLSLLNMVLRLVTKDKIGLE